jgi:hypothetical protein
MFLSKKAAPFLELKFEEFKGLRLWDESGAFVASYPHSSVPKEEQETILRSGESVWNVDSSVTGFVLKLTRNKHFVVSRLLVGSSGRILQVTGYLPKNKVTVRY